jgi:DNA-binding SARP family transcriptional activator
MGRAGPAVKVHLLGTIAVETPLGWRRGLPAQLRKVLALLAVTREAPQSAEQLVKRMWDGTPPESAGQMIRNQIRTLRGLFRAYGEDPIESTHGGYRFADGIQVDTEQFLLLMRQGRAFRTTGMTGEAVRVLETALSLWRGQEALPDVRDVLDLQVAAVGLEEQRFRAEELIVDGYLALGRPDDALPILRAMTLLHPSRELPWAQLMAAQALTGRRVEASGETYRQAYRHLVEETGLDAPLLERVHRGVLRGVGSRELVELLLSPAVNSA